MFKTISVIGGDLRQLTLAKLLEAEGYKVILYGFGNHPDAVQDEGDIDYALGCDIVILPVPVSFDGENINMQYSGKSVSTEELLQKINPASLVFGGQIKPLLKQRLEEKGVACRDYITREELAVRNAIPTAEGAIALAIEETPITVHGSKCLVMGYGKIGKILSKFLFGIGAQTFVEARKYADLAMIEGHGYEPVALCELKSRIHEFDIIFNTVPAMMLDEKLLRNLKKDALIIDLASKPGGADTKFG